MTFFFARSIMVFSAQRRRDSPVKPHAWCNNHESNTASQAVSLLLLNCDSMADGRRKQQRKDLFKKEDIFRGEKVRS